MSPRHLLAAAFATLVVAASGCVSILDVDSGDYADAADLICDCSAQANRCRGVIEGAIETSDPFQEIALGCLEDHGESCGEISSCLVAADYCSAPKQACASDSRGGAILRCCDGARCEGEACVEDESCAAKDQPCGGDVVCCNGGCNDGVCARRNQR